MSDDNPDRGDDMKLYNPHPREMRLPQITYGFMLASDYERRASEGMVVTNDQRMRFMFGRHGSGSHV